MLLSQREFAELGIVGITFGRLAIGFGNTGATGHAVDLLSLLALSGLSLYQDLSSAWQHKGYRYQSRHADSDGIAVGALSVPWAFAGALLSALRHDGPTGFARFSLCSSMASGSAMVAALAWRMHQRSAAGAPPEQAGVRGGQSGGADASASIVLNGSGGTAKGAKDAYGGALRSRAGKGSADGVAEPAATGISGISGKGGVVQAWGATPVVAAAGALVLLLMVASAYPGSAGLHSGQGGRMGDAYVGGPAAAVGIALNATAATGGMHLMLARLPNCFTIGEAMVVAQALSLLLWDVALLGASFAATLLPGARAACGGSTVSGPAWACRRGGALLASRSHVSLFVELLVFGALLVGLICAPLLRALFAATPGGAAAKSGAQRAGRRAGRGRGVDLRVVGALALVVGCAAAAAAFPAAWALEFALGTWRRAALLGYWVLILAAALPAMDWVSRARRVPTIIVRKGYHILAMALFAPALLLEPQLLAVSLAIATALLVVVEVARVGGVPFLGARIHAFMTSFIDSRDAGALLVSHFSLLAGMAAPVWLSAVSGAPLGACVPDLAAAFSGIMILGVADSAASAVGRRFGRHRILGTRKTLEGTLGGIIFTLLGWGLLWPLCACHGHDMGGSRGAGAVLGRVSGGVALWTVLVATVASCGLEAATTQLDNIFLPLHHYAMLSA